MVPGNAHVQDYHAMELQEPIAQALDAAVEDRRKRALALGQSSDPAAVTLLETMLKDPDESVVWFARHGLDLARQRQGEPDPVGAASVGTRLERETDSAALGMLCRRAGERMDTRTRDRLLPFLKHASPWVRACAVEGFWRWEDEIVKRAIPVLWKDDDARVRSHVVVFMVMHDRAETRAMVKKLLQPSVPLWGQLATVYGLGLAAKSWALKELSQVVASSNLPTVVRQLAREVIPASAPHQGTRDKASAKPDPTIRSELTRHLPPILDEAMMLEALRDPDVLVRVHALQNAGRFPPPVSLPVLHQMMEEERDPLFLATLMTTLGRIGGEPEFLTIERHLDDTDPRVRANALEVLSGQAREIVPEKLERLLTDANPRVRTQAAAYLFRRDPATAETHFRALVLGTENTAREGAFFTLSRLRETCVLNILRDALVDGRRHVYRQAYDVLVALAEEWPEAADALEEYREGQVAGEVAEGEPVSALLALMDSPAPADRIEAMKKLARAEDARVEMMLELNLAARDPAVRTKAAQVLSQRHMEQTLPRLFRRLGVNYTDATARGEAPVPRRLARQFNAMETEPLTAAGSEFGPGADEGERMLRLGHALYEAFRKQVFFDEMLRKSCQEIHSFQQQMASYDIAPGASKPRSRTPAGAEVGEVLPPDLPGQDSPRPVRSRAPGEEARESRRPYLVIGASLLLVVLVITGFAFELGWRLAQSGSTAAGGPGTTGSGQAGPGSSALFHTRGDR